jgi:hypothetical protein
MVTPCSVDGCDDPAIARGLCLRHYQRLRRTGDPEGSTARGAATAPTDASPPDPESWRLNAEFHDAQEALANDPRYRDDPSHAWEPPSSRFPNRDGVRRPPLVTSPAAREAT